MLAMMSKILGSMRGKLFNGVLFVYLCLSSDNRHLYDWYLLIIVKVLCFETELSWQGIQMELNSCILSHLGTILEVLCSE
jgi:hypothetical protein